MLCIVVLTLALLASGRVYVIENAESVSSSHRNTDLTGLYQEVTFSWNETERFEFSDSCVASPISSRIGVVYLLEAFEANCTNAAEAIRQLSGQHLEFAVIVAPNDCVYRWVDMFDPTGLVLGDANDLPTTMVSSCTLLKMENSTCLITAHVDHYFLMIFTVRLKIYQYTFLTLTILLLLLTLFTFAMDVRTNGFRISVQLGIYISAWIHCSFQMVIAIVNPINALHSMPFGAYMFLYVTALYTSYTAAAFMMSAWLQVIFASLLEPPKYHKPLKIITVAIGAFVTISVILIIIARSLYMELFATIMYACVAIAMASHAGIFIYHGIKLNKIITMSWKDFKIKDENQKNVVRLTTRVMITCGAVNLFVVAALIVSAIYDQLKDAPYAMAFLVILILSGSVYFMFALLMFFLYDFNIRKRRLRSSLENQKSSDKDSSLAVHMKELIVEQTV